LKNNGEEFKLKIITQKPKEMVEGQILLTNNVVALK